jgi:XrtJ-associated TM-motif-TM protein
MQQTTLPSTGRESGIGCQAHHPGSSFGEQYTMPEQYNKHEFEVDMNLKKTLLAVAFILVLAAALPLRAQTGCEDSPEDPTIVLALVGGAGALAAGFWKSRKR